MTPEEIRTLLSLIDKAVNGDGPWTARKAAIEAEASEDDTINLAEFSAWFVYDDDGSGEAA